MPGPHPAANSGRLDLLCGGNEGDRRALRELLPVRAHARESERRRAAAFVQKIGYKEQAVYFFDMANNKAYTSTELTAAQNLTWVFDDLLVGVTDEDLIAFTPTSS